MSNSHPLSNELHASVTLYAAMCPTAARSILHLNLETSSATNPGTNAANVSDLHATLKEHPSPNATLHLSRCAMTTSQTTSLYSEVTISDEKSVAQSKQTEETSSVI